jgi:ferric-dicitrate binding protein FerR (iron transport regulator)
MHIGPGGATGERVDERLRVRERLLMSSGENREVIAADWLARLDAGNASNEVLAEFEAWCRVDSRNLGAYLRLMGVWNRLDALTAEVAEGPNPRARRPRIQRCRIKSVVRT